MLYVFGVGEAAVSISSDPAQTDQLSHTMRQVGSVTRTLAKMVVGDRLGVRGPFGNAWPLDRCKGHDIVVVAGGIGLAPLWLLSTASWRTGSAFGRFILVAHGGRSPADLLFKAELDQWRERPDFDLLISVDRAIAEWHGPVGVVTDLMKRLRLRPERTSVMVCGPRIMNRFVTWQILRLRVPDDQLFVSLERNMRCGVVRCGHCQYGPRFVCKDGPVFSYASIRNVSGRNDILTDDLPPLRIPTANPSLPCISSALATAAKLQLLRPRR